MEKKEMMQIPISIVIPVYNAEKYIDRCINSVQNQIYKNWKLIIVDDGSTDKTMSICQKYKDDERIIYRRQKNQGVSKARNLGISLATGELITFIDADDWVEPEYLENFMKIPQSNYQITFQGFYMDYAGSVAKESKKEIPQDGYVLHLGAILGKMFSMQIIRENNISFDERLMLHEDHVFYYKCLQFVKSLRCSTAAAYHYMHYGETSLSRKLQTSKSYFLAFELLMNYYHYDTTAFDSEYKRNCIQMFGLNQLVMGIFSLYFERKPYKFRINLLREKSREISLFKKYYIPNSLSGKLFLIAYLYCSPVIQDLMFITVAKLFGSRLKRSLNLQ